MQILDFIVKIIIGVVAGWIAYLQWKTRHLKIKFELYERRMPVYNGLMEFLAEVIRDCKTDYDKAIEMMKKRGIEIFCLMIS